MIRYHPQLKGEHVYSETIGCLPCEVCGESADFSIRGSRYDDELKHVCRKHLESKEYIYQGCCDECKRSSFEPWLRTILVEPHLKHLCKKCVRELRSK